MHKTDNIESTGKGDTDLFKELVESFKEKAYSLTMNILKNKEDAEDSLQEAFLKLYKSLMQNKFEEKSKLSTYFYSIVYNTAIDHYKKLKSKRFSIVSIDVEDSNFEEGDDLIKKYYENSMSQSQESEMNTDKILTGNEIQKIVNNFINSIPEQYSVILTMFYINDLSHEEISGILKLPIGTVKNRIFRAKSKLKEIILKKYSEEELLQYV